MNFPRHIGNRRRRRVENLRKRRLKPEADRLEERLVLSAFPVTNTNDDGPGSLRVAIEDVNLDPVADGADIIEPQPADIGTIAILSELPALARDNVTIEGFALDGSQAGASVDGLDIAANNVSLVGLTISGFGGTGISVTGDQALITGSTITGNGGSGIAISGASGNTIGGGASGAGNLIGGNGIYGIEISESSQNLVIGNAVGITADLTGAMGNGVNGINVENEAPRPEAEVSGRPPRGGRFRAVAPVGGVDVNGPRLLSIVRRRPLLTHAPIAVAKRNSRRRHAGSLEALRVTRPEAVVS